MADIPESEEVQAHIEKVRLQLFQAILLNYNLHELGESLRCDALTLLKALDKSDLVLAPRPPGFENVAWDASCIYRDEQRRFDLQKSFLNDMAAGHCFEDTYAKYAGDQLEAANWWGHLE